jgi:RNA polymerase sigma-70 factor (ECF subfamily)
MSTPKDSVIAQLLKQAVGKQKEAENRLLAECRSYLLVLARVQLQGRLKAKIDASDIVQQTLLDAHKGFPQFRGQTPAEWLAWLRQILKNNLLNAARDYQTVKRQASREVPIASFDGSSGGVALSQISGQGETPSQLVLRKERELLLADALERLSPEHREVIILRNLQRLSFEEVAQQMHRSRPACQMLWMRAIEKLRIALVVNENSSQV